MEHGDPNDWSMDQVIDHLCHKDPPIWSQQPHIKTIPGLDVLEEALRANDIDGETFLALDEGVLKNEIGLQSFGQRRTILKVIAFLKSTSHHFQPLEIPLPSDDAQEQNPEPSTCAQDENFEAREPRRVAPLLISTAKPPGTDSVGREDDSGLPLYLQELLERHQAQTDESVYGGSQSSGSDATSIFDEYADLIEQVEDENRDIAGRRDLMTEAEVDEAIESACQEMGTRWSTDIPTRVTRRAYRLWHRCTRFEMRELVWQEHEAKLSAFQERLKRLISKIKEDYYSSAAEVKLRCGNLEGTVEDLKEQQYYIEILNKDTAPNKPPQKITKQHRVTSGIDESGIHYDIAESESDSTDEESVEHFTSAENHIIPEGLNDDYWSTTATPMTEELFTPQEIQEQMVLDNATQESLALSQKRNLLPMIHVTDSEHEDDTGDGDNSDLDRTPPLPQSRYKDKGRTMATAIDLLGSSPVAQDRSESSFRCNGSNQTVKGSSVSNLMLPRTHRYRFPPIAKTRARAWHTIPDDDPRLVLAKEVYQLDRSQEVASVLSFANTFEGRKAIVVLREILKHWSKEIIPNVTEDSQDDAKLFAYCFICYVTCRSWNLHLNAISQSFIITALNELQETALPFHSYFCALCNWYINQADFPDSENFESPQLPTKKRCASDASNHTITNDSLLHSEASEIEQNNTQTSARKKRKRAVKESQEAKDFQKNDLARVEEQERRRAEMMDKMQAIGSTGEHEIVPVNTAEPTIYLDQHIAQRAKSHQISGIQFIWRELIEDARHQGCLLAHTMGLGKTMQVISVLVTIAQCNSSPIRGVRELIPQHLRQNKTIILCPASLLDNWRDEIFMWTPQPHLLGRISLLRGPRDEKISHLRRWSAEGGIMVVSYESFRSLHNCKTIQDEKLRNEIQRCLVQEPTLVVADEAHKMKNSSSAVAKLTKTFKTSSRIALTGSPLNNHLVEYHTMIDWIAQGYLGSLVQFKSAYSEPISNGLYSDSSSYEKRQSLQKLHKLKRVLAPKINRADISAIAADMPQKTEFYITVTLTPAQEAAYTLIANHLLGYYKSSGKTASNANIWAWISILSWLCNHPSCLIKKLRERNGTGTIAKDDETPVARPSPAENEDDEDEHEQVPDNLDISNDSLIAPILPEIEQIFAETQLANSIGDEDPKLSYRSLITFQIVQEASKIGDKVLLFSHSIPTLNYLQSMVHQMGLKYLRIDGSTDTQKRQEATKMFNQTDSKYNVFLISTRAGGLGLNLQGANRVIIYDFGFNPSWEEQAIGRAYRFGQENPVFVYRFRTGGTFENAMYNTAVFKTQLFSRVVDYKNVMRHASKAVEQYLFVPTEVPIEDFSEARGKDPEVLDAIIGDEPEDFIRSIVLTETFQREDEDDELTPDERKAVDAELAADEMKKNDPVGYERMMREQHAKMHQARVDNYRAALHAAAPPFPFNPTVEEKPQPDPRPTETKDDIDLEKM